MDDITLPFEAGQIIHGKYAVIRLLGAGGVGFVVAARHIGFDEVVALKFLRPEYATDEDVVSRFTIEARASFKLRSDHVARVLDVDSYEQMPFIAMEFLEGSDLRSLLRQCGRFEIERSVDCMLQACEALASAHVNRIVHRDIKPENLFSVTTGDALERIKVLDFGISKVAFNAGRPVHQTLPDVVVGTAPYMSPEQVRAARDIDPRSDVWSLGCVLYELLTGEAPFNRITVVESCVAVLEQEPIAPIVVRPGVPQSLSDAILRCLQKDPASRFQDVAELAAALTPFGSGRFTRYAARCRAILLGKPPGRRWAARAPASGSARATGEPVDILASLETSIRRASRSLSWLAWTSVLVGALCLLVGYLVWRGHGQVASVPRLRPAALQAPMRHEDAPLVTALPASEFHELAPAPAGPERDGPALKSAPDASLMRRPKAKPRAIDKRAKSYLTDAEPDIGF